MDRGGVHDYGGWLSQLIEKQGQHFPDQMMRIADPLAECENDMHFLSDAAMAMAGRRGERGLGLGLATVRRLVQEHGGRCGVRSPIGGGSTFWFELFAAPPPPARPPLDDPPGTPTARLGASGSGAQTAAPATRHD